jgi:hypothetical protein
MKEKSMKHPQKKIEDFKNEDSRRVWEIGAETVTLVEWKIWGNLSLWRIASIKWSKKRRIANPKTNGQKIKKHNVLFAHKIKHQIYVQYKYVQWIVPHVFGQFFILNIKIYFGM